MLFIALNERMSDGVLCVIRRWHSSGADPTVMYYDLDRNDREAKEIGPFFETYDTKTQVDIAQRVPMQYREIGA